MSSIQIVESVLSDINIQSEAIFVLSNANTIKNCDIEVLSKNYLHSNEQLIINKRLKARAKKEYLASRIMIKQLISRIHPCSFFDIDVYFDEDKSQLKAREHFTDLPFTLSISHSKGLILIGITLLNDSFGVDIEFNNPKKDVTKLAKAFFHPDETKMIAQNGAHYFYQLWTIKEAAAKMLKQPIVTLLNKDIIAYITPYSLAVAQYEDYSLTILCDKAINKQRVNFVSIEDFYS